MTCPKCKKPLKTALLWAVEVSYCSSCLGLWFDKDELRWAKDTKDARLRWLDIDLWEKKSKFRLAYGIRRCPSCRVPLYEVYYGDSKVIIDVCNLCQGVWLDRGEFKKIIDYLKEKADYEILHNSAKNIFKEVSEVFTGPERLREEIVDVFVVLTALYYKLLAKYGVILQLIVRIPK